MASSFTLNTGSYQGRYLSVTCTQTKDIATNKNTINWTLTSTGGSSNYYATGPTTLTIAGQQVYYIARKSASSKAFPAAKGSVSGSLVVDAAANGSCSVGVSLTTAIYTATTSTVSNTWYLDDIPRAASLLTAPNFAGTDNPTITYSNPAGNAAVVQVAIYDTSGSTSYAGYRSVSATGSSYTFSLTDAERQKLINAVPNGTDNMYVRFYIKTIINGTTVEGSIRYLTRILTVKRAATLTSAPNFTDEDNPIITYNNPGGNTVDDVSAAIYTTDNVSLVAYRSVSLTGSSYTFELTDEERQALIAAIPNGKNSVDIKFYVTTNIDGTPYYSSLTRKLTVINAEPEMTIELNDFYGSIYEITNNPDSMIRGYNAIIFRTTPTLKKGATIINQSVANREQIKYGDTGGVEGMYDFLENVDDNVFVFSLTDSFGQTITKTATLEVIPYIKLTCDLKANNPTADGELAFKISGNYFNDDFGITNVFDGLLEKGMYSGTGVKADASDDLYRSVNPSTIDSNTDYVMTVNGVRQRFYVFFYDTNMSFISYGVTDEEGVFTSPENAVYVNFRCYTEDYVSDYENLNVRIEKGSYPSAINTLAVQWRIKENNGEYGEWIDVVCTPEESSYAVTVNLKGLNYRSTYTIQAKAGDILESSVLSIEKIVKSITVYNWGENNFDINVPLTVDEIVCNDIFTGQLELGSYDSKTGEKLDSTEASPIYQYRSSDPIEVESLTSYVIRIDDTPKKQVVLFYDENNAFLSETRNVQDDGIFVTPENTKYITFRCFASDYSEYFSDFKVEIVKLSPIKTKSINGISLLGSGNIELPIMNVGKIRCGLLENFTLPAASTTKYPMETIYFKSSDGLANISDNNITFDKRVKFIMVEFHNNNRNEFNIYPQMWGVQKPITLTSGTKHATCFFVNESGDYGYFSLPMYCGSAQTFTVSDYWNYVDVTYLYL